MDILHVSSLGPCTSWYNTSAVQQTGNINIRFLYSVLLDELLFGAVHFPESTTEHSMHSESS